VAWSGGRPAELVRSERKSPGLDDRESEQDSLLMLFNADVKAIDFPLPQLPQDSNVTGGRYVGFLTARLVHRGRGTGCGSFKAVELNASRQRDICDTKD